MWRSYNLSPQPVWRDHIRAEKSFFTIIAAWAVATLWLGAYHPAYDTTAWYLVRHSDGGIFYDRVGEVECRARAHAEQTVCLSANDLEQHHLTQPRHSAL